MNKQVEQIKDRIEKLKKLVDDPVLLNNDLIIGERNAYIRLLSFINSLKEEPISKSLAEAATCYVNEHCTNAFNAELVGEGFIAGANWHLQYMAKEIVEGHIINNDGTFQLICPSLPIVTRNMEEGDRVKLVIIKEDLL